MTCIDKLEELQAEIQDSSAILTFSQRRDWVNKLEKILEELALTLDAEQGDEDEDDEGDEDDEPGEGTSYLSPKAAYQVAYVLRRAEWQVKEDPESAVLDLCEKARDAGRPW
jgi:hypothetical protein